MEYLEGETLEDRLRKGPLAVDDVLRIGREIAEAVDAAHKRSVVHRDLKPGNVMLSKTGTKVLDFGLAREITAPGDVVNTQAATVPAITGEGTLVGTMPYMAPEQIEGKAPDKRSDIWALGCILYEMATGDRPFGGETQASLISSIMTAEPLPPSRKQPLTPQQLDWLVIRCLDKNPERRWQSSGDLGIELHSIGNALPSGSSKEVEPVTGKAPRRFGHALSITAVLVLGLVIGWWRWGGIGQPIAEEDALPQSLLSRAAILPFHNTTDRPELDEVGLGIWEELFVLMTRPSALPGVLVTIGERETLLAHAGESPCVAGRALNARWVYGGSLRRVGEQLRISAALWDCNNDRQIWSESYNRDTDQSLSLQVEIAERIYGESNQAWNLYTFTQSGDEIPALIGRRTRKDNEKVLRLLREGLERSPSDIGFRNYTIMAYMQALNEGWADPQEAVTSMRAATKECHTLEPQLPICQWMTGFTELYAGDRQRMLAGMQRHHDLQGQPGTLAFLGLAQGLAGDSEVAIANLEEAIRLSPDDDAMAIFLMAYAGAHYIAEHYQKARDAATSCIKLNAHDPWNSMAICYQHLAASQAQLGELEKARVALEEARILRPALTAEVALAPWATSSPEHRERYLAGLRMAGLEE